MRGEPPENKQRCVVAGPKAWGGPWPGPAPSPDTPGRAGSARARGGSGVGGGRAPAGAGPESRAAPALILRGNRPRRRLARDSSSPPQSHKPCSKELKEKRNQPPVAKDYAPFPFRNSTDRSFDENVQQAASIPFSLKFNRDFTTATTSVRRSGGKALRKCATTVVNVLKMAAAPEGGGRGRAAPRRALGKP